MLIDISRTHFSRATSKVCPTNRVMVISDDRALYCGLLGDRSPMQYGAFAFFVSFDRPFSIRVDGGAWEEKTIALVPPYVSHEVKSPDRLIAILLIDSESVDEVFFAEHEDYLKLHQVEENIRALYARLLGNGFEHRNYAHNLDSEIFGRALPQREMDARIRWVTDMIKADPTQRRSAEECAKKVGVSFSRFVHLFQKEMGTTYRKFRAWKRARAVLVYMNRNVSLVDVALEVGYPDSTHFSHCMRQVYGIKPREIFAGCRRLAVLS